MYAVVRTGGKQVWVTPGKAVRVEKLPGEVGDPISLDEVLLVGDEGGEPRVGTPLVDGAKVVGKITAQGKGPKIRVFKMKRRKNYSRRQGHRQKYTEIQIEKIEG
jgi:large subunit ribosomal protein L21